ncbi:MAG: hypothetical protein ACK5ZG_10210 [Phycisphaerae bacterium]
MQLDEPEDAAQVHHVEVEEVRGGDGIGDGAVVVARAHGVQMLVGGGDELQVRIDVVGRGTARGCEIGHAGLGVDERDGGGGLLRGGGSL